MEKNTTDPVLNSDLTHNNTSIQYFIYLSFEFTWISCVGSLRIVKEIGLSLLLLFMPPTQIIMPEWGKWSFASYTIVLFARKCASFTLTHQSCFATSISLPFQIQQLLCYLLAKKVMITFSIGIQHASMQLKPNDLSFHLATREIFFSLCGICCRLL